MIKQIIEQECQETNINIDYYDKVIRIYTNKSTVMNRLLNMNYEPKNIDKMNGEICSVSFEFTFDKFPSFIGKGVFKCS